MSTIKDLNLAPSGERKIRWVEAHMPVLRDIGSDFAREKPFAGLKIALSVHLEAKTAYLCRVLEMGGAEMHVTGSNPLSTQDDVAAALAAKGMDVHAVYGCSDEEYQAHLRSVLSFLAMPEIGQPEMYIQWKDGLVVDGAIGEASREHVQKFVDAFVAWVKQHPA